MEEWQIGLGGGVGGVTLLGLLWRAMGALVRAEVALTTLTNALKTTLDKHVTHIVEEHRHHKVVEEYLHAISNAPIEVERAPSGRIQVQTHRVAEEVSQ